MSNKPEKLGALKLSLILVGIVYFVLTIFIRIPFFFRDYIDLDESTFILMGQSYVNGHLPYTELWDLKPPMLFFTFAALIAVFGKSFIAIRFAAALIVACTAVFVYLITEQLASKRAAFWSGILCLCTFSLFGSLQGLMSEHLCVFAFMPAIYLLGKWPLHMGAVLFSGILLGYAVMCKLNMAYPTLLIGMVYWALIPRFTWFKAILLTFLLGLGVLFTVFLTILPYWLAGEWDTWLQCVIMAPMAYETHPSLVQKLIIALIGLLLLFLCFCFFRRQRSLIQANKKYFLLLMASVVGVIFSFIDLGKVNVHYLVQLYPMLIVLFCVWLSISVKRRASVQWVFFLLLVLAPVEAYMEYDLLTKRLTHGKSLYNEEGFEVPEYFDQKGIHPKNIWFLKYHIGYWLLNAKPPSKIVTHPSNLYREELYPFMDVKSRTAREEINRIINILKPDYVVGDAYTDSISMELESKVTDKDQQNAWYLARHLLRNYKRVTIIGKAGIFKRTR